MTTVFLSGSRKIGRMADEVRGRLENMVQKGLTIVIGDANGADRAMQSCLHDLGYSDVTVYFVGAAPRNNVGNWPTRNVVVDAKLQGRDFYARKDEEMAGVADLGFVLWDGKSSGSVQNMQWLLAQKKAVVVYYAPDRQFYNFRSEAELVDLLSGCDDEVLKDLDRKIHLPDRLKEASRRQQAFNL